MGVAAGAGLVFSVCASTEAALKMASELTSNNLIIKIFPLLELTRPECYTNFYRCGSAAMFVANTVMIKCYRQPVSKVLRREQSPTKEWF